MGWLSPSAPRRHRARARLGRFAWTAALLALLAGPAAAADAAAVAASLRDEVGRLAARGGLYVQGLPIATGTLLPTFYQARDYAPVWTRPERVAELFALLATAEAHGLQASDYHLEQLRQLVADYGRHPDALKGARLDLLLTESLVRFGYHQRFGKVNPQRMEPTWNFTREYRPGQDPRSTLEAAVAAPSLADFLNQWLRRVPLYPRLQAYLAEYRAIADRGGWPVVPDGPTLRPGETDPRLPVLRERLRITGDLAAAADLEPTDPLLYAGGLVEAVRTLQARHALTPDGVVGRQTLAALNVPVEVRIDQLRMTLERARWVIDDTARDAVIVNIAGFEVFVLRAGRVAWWRRAVVGRAYRQTPIFKGLMTYIDLNPTWTIPPTILRQDILPKVRRDPAYLSRNNITVLDAAGRTVEPMSVDWRALGSRIPYTLRQEPGPGNALGRIKFMFPNPHAVFLHDTPARELFERPERLFSSGCIRVEDPLALAEIVLGDPDAWNQASLQAAIDAGRTRTIRLPRPWPVLIMYWTAELDGAGRVRFLRDVYDRDPALLQALNGEVIIEFPGAGQASVRRGE